MANVSSSNGLEKYPKLRFKGFSEPYMVVPLGDIACEVNRTDPNSKAPVMMLSAGNGFIMQSEKYSRDNAGQSLKKYTLLKKGELAYNHGASKAKQFGCCYQLELDEALVPFVYHCFGVNNEYAPYISTVLNLSTTERQLKRLVSSSVRMDGLLNISYDDYMTVELALPSLDEQQKVSCFLSLLDEKIKKQQRLVEHLKKYKRGFFKSIISGQFANIGFDTAKWERKCLSELFSISAGGDIDKDRFSPIQSESHPYPVYANAKTNDGLYGYANYYKSQENTITVSGRGEVGFAVARRTKYVPIVRLLSLVPKEPLDIDFYTLIINNTNIFVESTGVPQLTSPQLGKLIVPYAPLEEQRKIAKIFNGIDVRIANSEKELDALYLLRQSLLNKVFI